MSASVTLFAGPNPRRIASLTSLGSRCPSLLPRTRTLAAFAAPGASHSHLVRVTPRFPYSVNGPSTSHPLQHTSQGRHVAGWAGLQSMGASAITFFKDLGSRDGDGSRFATHHLSAGAPSSEVMR